MNRFLVILFAAAAIYFNHHGASGMDVWGSLILAGLMHVAAEVEASR